MTAHEAAVRAGTEALASVDDWKWNEQAKHVLAAIATDPDVLAALVRAPCVQNNYRDQMCGRGTWSHPACFLAALCPPEAPDAEVG